MDIGGIGDAAIGDDAVEEGLDKLPFLEEVPEEDPLLRIVLVVFSGVQRSGDGRGGVDGVFHGGVANVSGRSCLPS